MTHPLNIGARGTPFAKAENQLRGKREARHRVRCLVLLGGACSFADFGLAVLDQNDWTRASEYHKPSFVYQNTIR